MPSDHEARYASESRSSEELADLFLREGWDTDAGHHAIVTLHYRGGHTEFELGRRLTMSANPVERAAGADILGQLGFGPKNYHEESIAILIPMLGDPDTRVLGSAAFALGHRNEPRAIPALCSLVNHSSVEVRRAVVHGLLCHDHLDAIAGLIELSRDPDDNTRDWATFALGKQTSLDTPELRDALAARLIDTDAEIRGEAMIGLALRKDNRARPAIEAALRGSFYGDWPLEAAEHLPCPDWIPLIERHRQAADPEDAANFANSFEAALTACRQTHSRQSPIA